VGPKKSTPIVKRRGGDRGYGVAVKEPGWRDIVRIYQEMETGKERIEMLGKAEGREGGDIGCRVGNEKGGGSG